MTAHHDHALPTLGCHLDPCAGWSRQMLADDDRDLEELVLTIERATTTLLLRQQTGTLVDVTVEDDSRRMARVVLASCAQRSAAHHVIAQLQQAHRDLHHQDPFDPDRHQHPEEQTP